MQTGSHVTIGGPCCLQSSDWVVFNTSQQLELMRVPCGGWHRPFTFHCLSPTHLVFVHYQPRSSSTHVHRRRRCPVPPLLTPPASDGAPRGWKQGSEGSEGVAPGSEGGEQRLRESAHGSQGGADGSYAGVSGLAEPMTNLHAVHHGREVLCCALLPSFRVHSAHVPSADPAHEKSPSSSSALLDCSSPASRPESSILHNASSGNDDPNMPAHQAASSASPLCLLTGSEDGTMRQLLCNPQEPFPGQASQSSSGQHPSLNGEPQLDDRQTQSCSEQNQPVNGQSMPSSQQSGTLNGQNGSSSRQSLPGNEQEGSTAGGNGHPRGLFGAGEVGFQAAGSAVKSIVTIPAGPGMHVMIVNIRTSRIVFVAAITTCACADKLFEVQSLVYACIWLLLRLDEAATGTASKCLLGDRTQHGAITCAIICDMSILLQQ